MKKILSIIAAGSLALLALSCVKQEMAVVDFTKATAPAIQSAEVGKDLVIQYTPAVFNMDFNKNMKTYHTIALVSIGGQNANVTLSAKADGDKLTVSGKTISNLLKGRNYQIGDVVALEAVVRGSIQDPSRGITNGFVDSKEKFPFSWEVPEDAQGSPYEEYTEVSDWSLIGSIAAYEINWDKDLNMWTDGNGRHVAAHVTLTAGDEVKFRKDQGWAENMGGDFSSLDGEFSVTQDGPNIKIAATGVYDLFLDLNGGSAVVSEAYDPYPEYTEASNWSVIGSIAAYENAWNKDLPMVTDGTNHVAFAVTITDGDEFKFRQDAGWAVNMGGDFESVGGEFAVTQDGPNIKAPAGVYDIFLNPGSATATVAETSGMKVSSIIGGDEPEPEPEPTYKGWGIIGDFNGWGGDEAMTEKDGVWTGYFTNKDKEDGSHGQFKFRKDAEWAENLGAAGDADPTEVTLGTPIGAAADGKNLVAPAGFYKAELNLTDEANPTITITEGEMWSLIGDFNSWSADVNMVLTDGKWVSPATQLNAKGFKIRHNHDWTLSVGGEFAALGEPFAAVSQDGPNIMLEEDGEYIVTFDPEAMTIVVEAALPSNTWSLIGVNGDWNNDIFMTEVMPGVWMSPKVEITTPGWKLRFNHDWGVNRGSEELDAEGKFVKGVQDGKDIALTGTFNVVYNANNGTMGTLVWGIVGSVASIDGFNWNKDVPMNLGSDGKWYSIPIVLTKSDEIKIRQYADWAVSLGGACTAAEEAFEAISDNGPNFKAPEDGTYMVVYDPAEGTITLTKDYWGMIGSFNSWSSDVFMMFDGAKWVAYNQSLKDQEWKIRHSADWTLSVGGAYTTAGEAFEAVSDNGPNIKVTDLEVFDVIYDTTAKTIVVNK